MIDNASIVLIVTTVAGFWIIGYGFGKAIAFVRAIRGAT